MGEFLEFLQQHMAFTEEMIHYTMHIGDIVEQAIRASNLEVFKKNHEKDAKIFAKQKEILRKKKFE